MHLNILIFWKQKQSNINLDMYISVPKQIALTFSFWAGKYITAKFFERLFIIQNNISWGKLGWSLDEDFGPFIILVDHMFQLKNKILKIGQVCSKVSVTKWVKDASFLIFLF